tara:strand:+ start:3180 stop:3959 length:780 start_codon:yes stop_codon:yes gene_type:complete
MSTSSIPYAANIRSFELLERQRSQITDIKIYRDNAQIVPSAGLYSLLKPDGSYVVEDGVVAIDSDGTCSYTHSSANLAKSLALGEGYMQLWKITISGTEYIFRRMASLVLRRLYPVISDVDLTRVYSNLEDVRPSSITSYQKYIDDAWYTILRRIRSRNEGFEYLITSPEAFYECHRHLSLYLIFRDFHSSLGQSTGRYLDLANEHNRAFHAEFEGINWLYDEDHSGQPDDPNSRTRSQPTIFLNRTGNYSRRRRYVIK